jgi:hypothetical protein
MTSVQQSALFKGYILGLGIIRRFLGCVQLQKDCGLTIAQYGLLTGCVSSTHTSAYLTAITSDTTPVYSPVW